MSDKREFKSVIYEFADLTQKQVEQWSAALKGAHEKTVPEYRGDVVRAAIRAGWVLAPELKPEDVDAMPPRLVRWLADQCAGLYNDATQLDPL